MINSVKEIPKPDLTTPPFDLDPPLGTATLIPQCGDDARRAETPNNELSDKETGKKSDKDNRNVEKPLWGDNSVLHRPTRLLTAPERYSNIYC